MATETKKYEDAIAQLESIVQRMEQGNMSIDSLASELEKAQQLLRFCRERLTKVDGDIKKILE